MAKANKVLADNEITHRKPVVRSVAYPSFTIEYAIEFTKNVYSNFGTSKYNTRETIAHVLKKSAEYLKAPISTCVQYGLLEMRSKIGYKPTPLFMDLYKQDDEVKLRESLLRCLREPTLYATLLDIYKGDIVPPITAIANNLFKNHGIAENTAEKAASVFVENLNHLNLISKDNKLIDFTDIAIEQVNDITALKNTAGKPQDESNNDLVRPEDNTNNDFTGSEKTFIVEVPLLDNRKAKVLCPIDISNRDWKKIIKILNSYIDDDNE